MSKMLKSSGAMALATVTSRVLGMVREMVYAALMGNEWQAGAFFFAFAGFAAFGDGFFAGLGAFFFA